MDKADIIIEDGKIVQVGAELEVPSGNCSLHVCKKRELSICYINVYTSPVWKIQKMVKNPCLSVKNMRIGCEKFQKKFGLNWRFP